MLNAECRVPSVQRRTPNTAAPARWTMNTERRTPRAPTANRCRGDDKRRRPKRRASRDVRGEGRLSAAVAGAYMQHGTFRETLFLLEKRPVRGETCLQGCSRGSVRWGVHVRWRRARCRGALCVGRLETD